LRFVYRIFIKGVLTLLPISLTIYLLVWCAGTMENVFGGPLQNLFPSLNGFTGAGFLLGMTLVFLVGLAVNSYLTQRFVEWIDQRLENLPVIRTIYGPIRDVTNLFGSQGASSQQRVVLVNVDGKEGGIEALGLITRDTFLDLPPNSVLPGSVAVFIPFSYGMGGITMVVPRTRVRETAIPADRAMQLAITGWIKSSK
jgi:uncharacterized membrane protein